MLSRRSTSCTSSNSPRSRRFRRATRPQGPPPMTKTRFGSAIIERSEKTEIVRHRLHHSAVQGCHNHNPPDSGRLSYVQLPNHFVRYRLGLTVTEPCPPLNIGGYYRARYGVPLGRTTLRRVCVVLLQYVLISCAVATLLLA